VEAKNAIEKDLSSNRHKIQSVQFINTLEVDISSFTSIKKAASVFFEQKEPRRRLDSLILNAGIMAQPFTLTEDGLELTMGTNHFGHFLLTMLLVPALKDSSQGNKDEGTSQRLPATVSVHSSAAQFEAPHLVDSTGSSEGLSPYYLERLSDTVAGRDRAASNATWYDAFDAYRQSKLANVLFAQELAEQLKQDNILVNSHAPGAVRTNLLSHILGKIESDGPVFGGGGVLEEFLGKWGRYLLLKYILPLHQIIWSPEDACLTQVYTAVSSDLRVRRVTGQYFQSVARRTDPDLHAQNKTLQRMLWKKSEELTGSTLSVDAET